MRFKFSANGYVFMYFKFFFNEDWPKTGIFIMKILILRTGIYFRAEQPRILRITIKNYNLILIKLRSHRHLLIILPFCSSILLSVRFRKAPIQYHNVFFYIFTFWICLSIFFCDTLVEYWPDSNSILDNLLSNIFNRF